MESRFLYTVEQIDGLLVARMEALAPQLLPDGEKHGHEWVAKNPGRADRRRGSLSVNLTTGVWKDFASGQGAKHLPGLGLVANFATAGNFLEAIVWAKRWLGLEEGSPPSVARAKEVEEAARAAREKREADEQHRAKYKRDLAFKLFLEARALTGDCPASLYLAGRGLKLATWPRSLRFHPGISHPAHGATYPALIACMSLEGLGNGFGGIHRIYLQRAAGGWVKAFGGEDAKLALGYASGATVRISNGASGKKLRDAPLGEDLLLTEGIEDALALSIALPDARVCAAYSLAAIGAARFPENVQRVTIVADNDDGPAVQQLENAAAALAHRHEFVSIARMPREFKDVNDALLGKRRGG